MKKILFLILAIVISSLMIGCGGSSSSDDTDYKSVTVLYYGIGDKSGSSDLSGDIKDDIKTFSKYSKYEKVKVLCEFKLNNSKDIRRGLVSECGDSWKNYPVISQDTLGNGDTFKEFIEYGQKNAPSDEYIIILASHGDGYYSSETKACIWGNDDSYLANGTVGEVCKPFNIDACIYDCCLMACLENLTCIKDAFKYVIATEYTLTNMNKDFLMNSLIYHDNLKDALEEFAQKQFVDYNKKTDVHLIDCSKLNNVLTSAKNITTFLNKNYNKYSDKIIYAKTMILPVEEGTNLYDFIDVCNKINKSINDSNFQNLLDTYKETSNEAIIFNGTVKETTKKGPANGFSVLYPNPSDYVKTYQKNYPQTDFAKATDWDKFIEKSITK